MNKRIIAIAASAVFTFTCIFGSSAYADGLFKKIDVIVNSVKINVNNKPVSVDNFVHNGTTYVPLRAISEMLGKKINWTLETSTVDINDDNSKNSSDSNNSSVTFTERLDLRNDFIAYQYYEVFYNWTLLFEKNSEQLVNSKNMIYFGNTKNIYDKTIKEMKENKETFNNPDYASTIEYFRSVKDVSTSNDFEEIIKDIRMYFEDIDTASMYLSSFYITKDKSDKDFNEYYDYHEKALIHLRDARSKIITGKTKKTKVITDLLSSSK